ncbi:MAG: hypothetical protein K2M03_03380 [Muribaculaceae bacterium]|nr:hypothetical protein [Muribaculaceae bacterium]
MCRAMYMLSLRDNIANIISFINVVAERLYLINPVQRAGIADATHRHACRGATASD